MSAVTEPLSIDENENDDDEEYESDSHNEEDLEEGAEDSLWGTAITMSW